MEKFIIEDFDQDKRILFQLFHNKYQATRSSKDKNITNVFVILYVVTSKVGIGRSVGGGRVGNTHFLLILTRPN